MEAARALDRPTYTYTVPGGLELVPGHRVVVPFGRREARGYVVSVHTESPSLALKDVLRSEPAEPLLLPHQIEMARAVSEHYWAPLMECVLAMVPPRIRHGRSTGSGESSRQTRHSRLLDIARQAVR